ncbi:uncharacterized protein [Dendrobates tinctorius]|uniref:uncharacterized protein n=1 Tax=Dendrobates tinctorius TaxID=92724 RepID=UPI003CCA12C8
MITIFSANLSLELVDNVKETLLTVELQQLQSSFSSYTTEQWQALFEIHITLLVQYFNATLLELLPTSISCNSYQAIVKGFSLASSNLDEDTGRDIYNFFIKRYMTQQATSGDIACGTVDYDTWIKSNFDYFFKYATTEDLIIYNKNLTQIALTPNELAGLVTRTDVLQNETLLISYLSKVEIENVTIFLTALTSAAENANLSQELVDNVKETLLAVELQQLQSSLSSYTTLQWKDLFEIRLTLLIQYFNATLLELLPTSISCSSYQAIVKVFSLESSELSDDTGRDIYNSFIKRYMTQQATSADIACGAVDYETWIQINFDYFFKYATTEELIIYNKNLTQIALTPNELAGLVTRTDVLQNETLLISYLSKVELENVTIFLTALTSAAEKANLSQELVDNVKETLLAVELQQLQSSFSSYTTEQWQDLFEIRLTLLIQYFNATLLELLPTSISCSSYQAIVKGFSLDSSALSDDTGRDIYNYFIKRYMTQQATSADFACGAVNYEIWIQNNFAYFFKYCTAEESIFYNKTFTEGAVFLASMAISVTSPEVLANETLLISYLSKINLENITAFVNALASSSEKANLTVDQVATIGRTLLTVQLQQLQSNFSSYSTQQWTELFEVQMAILIPYFNQTTLQMLPISIPCSSFQAIMKGFSLVFTALTKETKVDIYNSFIKNYMGHQSFPTGVACDTGNQETWLTLNFGKFVAESSYEDLSAFNANLTKLESIATITPTNLADMTITVDAIQNITLNGIVITNIKQLKSMTQLNEYIVQLQSYVCAISSPSSGTSLCANSAVLQNSTKSAIFSAVWDVLEKSWSPSIEQQWLENFKIMAKMFSLEITEPTISQFPKDIKCETAQGIIASINSSFGLLASNIQKAVYQYLLDYHKGSALLCDTSSDLQLFFDEYFEASSALLNPEDLVSLLQNEQLLAKLNSLTPQDLVFYLQPDTNTNSTLWSIILSHYTDISQLGEVIDRLNIKTDDINLAVFKSVWPIFVSNSNLLNDSDMQKWFSDRFNNSIKLITLEQLNVTGVINANCLFYENLVKTLSKHYGEYNDNTRQDIYNVLKEYLQTGPNPRCYTEGNYSWIVYHLEDYLSFCSADDLRSFSSEALLQMFSVDNKTLDLVARLTLNEDLKAYYAQLLTTENSNFPLNNIPQNILCYAIANLNIGTITGDQAKVTLNLLKSCNYGINSTVDKEALTGLLSSTTITSSLLQSLGSLAVGLSTSTIENTDSITLSESLSTLSNIDGWTVTQASAIVNKIIQTDSPITVNMFQNLGTLIIGVSSSKISSLSSENVLALASNSIFSAHMEQAPVALKQKFVQMIIQASSSKNIFQSVPPNLASEIPASNLLSSSLNFSDISGMKWRTSQARVFFRTVLIQVTDYSKLSSNILQGFTCGAANNLNNNQFVNLIKSMNGKSVNLDSSQLNCLAKRLTISGATADFSSYSSDVLLYLGPYTKPSECENYFTSVGKANIDLLAQGSARRVSLMSSARTCLNIGSASVITKETIQKLGSLACDLSDNEIKNSDPYILQALKSCTSFTDSQKSAILLKLKATYGDPSLWTVSTMGQIGSLSSAIDGATLKLINTAVKRQFFPGFLTTMKTQYKTVFHLVMSQLKVSSRIATRAAPDCEELTTDLIAKQKEYIVISYTAGQLDACLSNITLKDNLEILGSLAFENDQLQVLKSKLDTIFPTTVPNEYLIQIGNIARMYSTDEMSLWNITTVDTLADILEGASWQTNDSKINALVTQYLSSSTEGLDGTALTVLAPYICGLNEATIQKIPDNELKISSQPLDTSTCTQGQKDLLFSKMKSAYSTSENSSNAYYEIMSSVIGGSKSEDLVLFAKSNPEMDITTFTSLNPSEVKKLSAENIKALLGNSISDIDTINNSSVLQAWVSVNTQTEINKLGLGVTGGVNETLPDDFIAISLVTPTSGASSFSFIYLLNACTLVVIFYINNLFL